MSGFKATSACSGSSISTDEPSGNFSINAMQGHQPKATASHQTRSDSKKIERLIDWNVDVMLKLLRSIAATRHVVTQGESLLVDWPTSLAAYKEASTPFDEVKEIISIPEYNDAIGLVNKEPQQYTISETVRTQLKSYLSSIADRYNENHFHSFEHASHVVSQGLLPVSQVTLCDTVCWCWR
jgi:hypothetical protein